MRQARVAYANSQNAAANQGAMTSSGEAGGTGGIASQLTGNLDYLTQYNQYSKQSSSAEAAAGIFGSVATFGKTVFDNADAIAAKANSLFG